MLNASQDLIAQWRSNADASNPAGPLYAGGDLAEADIVGETNAITLGPACGSGLVPTACSGRPCC